MRDGVAEGEHDGECGDHGAAQEDGLQGCRRGH